MKVREHKLKIGVSGIRGEIGEFLTPAMACDFAQAFGTYVGPGRVVVGRDTRTSGEMLEHAVACGLLATGCEVVQIGVQPTPTVQIYVSETGARGGLAITASHNSSEYNALKLFNGEGLFFNSYERSELIDLYHQSAFHHAKNDRIGNVSYDLERARQFHIARVLQHADVDRIRRRRFRVAIDSVNGAGSEMSCEFLEKHLNCEVVAISVDPTKPFPRIPEPRPDTLTDLAAAVRDNQCDIGFGQDPDADRLAVCDELGHVLDNDDVLALAVDAALERAEGPVVVNLTTSSVIDDVAARHNRVVHRTPVGEANVVEMMLVSGAAIGGEGSNGGIIFPSVHPCRDSYTGMVFMLDRLAATGSTVSEIAGTLPRYHRKLGKVGFQHGKLGPLMQALADRFPDAKRNRADGLKLLMDRKWVHVRASNTEPIMRIAVEAGSEEEVVELYGIASELLSSAD
jgi:phosphomannomutase